MQAGRRRAAVTAILAILLLLPMLPSASAEPAASTAAARPDPQAELRNLTKQADSLNKAYRGQIQDLEEIRVQAKKATDRSTDLRRALAEAEREVARHAQTAYMGGSLDSAQIFGGGDPGNLLGPAATMSQLASVRAGQLDRMRDLVASASKARKTAQSKIASMKKTISTLQGKRRKMERLLAKYGFQTPTSSAGLTGRMVAVRDTVLRQFPMPFTYGCLRPGDPGDHGSGRACDFMMSSGGAMPDQVGMERGDALANWAIKNGAQVGVMYIIWKQRYYDVRTGSGWRPMSDRGGNTANHWDHVHVSVF